jgi:CelD/BcsL family acetyltransferase involved in cellulose biosynthesis
MSSNDRYRSEVITETEALQRLRGDWDDLFRRAARPDVSQSFEWVLAAWETVGKPRSGQLNVVVLRENGRAVLIWPLVVYRHRRHWRAVHPLLPSEDFHPLVEDCADSRQMASAALDLVRKGRRYDLLFTEWVRLQSPLGQVLDPVSPIDAEGHHGISWDGIAEWEAYERGIPSQREIKRRLRRLHELGEVKFDILEDASAQVELVPWLMERKLQRFADLKDTPMWDPTQQSNFMSTAMRTVRTFGRFLSFTLRLKGELIALLIAVKGPARLTIYQHTQQPGFEKFGPGILIWHNCLRYAFDNKLDVSFGSGRPPYKGMFSNREILHARWSVPTSMWGEVRRGMTRLGDWRRSRREPAADRGA